MSSSAQRVYFAFVVVGPSSAPLRCTVVLGMTQIVHRRPPCDEFACADAAQRYDRDVIDVPFEEVDSP